MITLQQLPPWALMWLLALGLYAAGKAATLAGSGLRATPAGRRMAYLLLFPGMNANAFCRPKTHRRAAQINRRLGMRFAIQVLLGAMLLWGLARTVPAEYALLRGWVGMTGTVLLLHFGLLQLIGLAWRAKGVAGPLLMDAPARSQSVGEFWGQRWNTAFRQLSHQFIFRPLARPLGPRAAMALTFVLSGLVHDLVISVPAGGGYGLPTAYFALQAAAVQFEKSPIGRALLAHPAAARLFTIAIVALPAPALFHPLFIRRVFLPFMHAVGAVP